MSIKLKNRTYRPLGAYPGVDKHGVFNLFGDDCNYLWSMNAAATEHAYRLARQARFEHGETPRVRRFI